MQVFENEVFFREQANRMFYVGFLKSPKAWFPLCIVSDPENATKLDTLVVSLSYQLMDETVKKYAQQVSQVEETFVQYLIMEEVGNLTEKYALRNVVVIEPDVDLDGGCGCGCGCG